MRGCWLSVVVMAMASWAAAEELPLVGIPETQDPPSIDGAVTEGEWADAAVTCGFWPVIAARSFTAPSMILPSRAASPTPVFTTILTSPGTWCTFVNPKSFFSWAEISVLYFCFRRG